MKEYGINSIRYSKQRLLNKMRGYNQDDVDDFLDQVTRDYEDALQKIVNLRNH